MPQLPAYVRQYFFLLLCCFFVMNTFGQISFFYNDTPSNDSYRLFSYYIDSSAQRNWNRYTEIESKLKSYEGEDFNLSYKNKMIWIKLDLKKSNSPFLPHYLMVRNPHINFINVWIQKRDSLYFSFPPTGDRYAFASRSFLHSDFVFPLPIKSKEDISIIILLDKRNEIINIPIHLLNDEGLIKNIQTKNIIGGLFIGLSLFLFLFNLFLFFNLRDRLYIFYGLYIIVALYYIFSDLGFSFMFLFPGYPLYSDFMRPLSIALATPLYISFCLELLNTRKEFPVYYKWIKRSVIIYVIILLVAAFLMKDTGRIRVILSGVSYTLINLFMFGNVFIAIVSYKKRISFALYVIISSVLLMIFVGLFSLYLSGDISDTLLTRNLMRIALITEICILTLVISLRFKRYKEKSEELALMAKQQERQIFKQISTFQENEQKLFSSRLHDHVGAHLSGLRLHFESILQNNKDESLFVKLNSGISEINRLAEDVREMSHSASPILLQQKGLIATLGDQIKRINETGSIYIQFESIGSLQHTSFRYELMLYNITQELIQNILRHSNATESIIQIMLEERFISLFVEDNGKGFDNSVFKAGLGFTQINQLVTFVNGKMTIEAKENAGCRISIEFPVLEDEPVV